MTFFFYLNLKNKIKRVRGFDRKYFKPIFLREKALSKDEKLLSTFKKINELNIAKMAEDQNVFFLYFYSNEIFFQYL
jgi:hypothetical protein